MLHIRTAFLPKVEHPETAAIVLGHFAADQLKMFRALVNHYRERVQRNPSLSIDDRESARLDELAHIARGAAIESWHYVLAAAEEHDQIEAWFVNNPSDGRRLGATKL